jgi:hypothetical protein
MNKYNAVILIYGTSGEAQEFWENFHSNELKKCAS